MLDPHHGSSQQPHVVRIIVILLYRWGNWDPERLGHLPWVTQLDLAELGSRFRWSDFQGFVLSPTLYHPQASTRDSLPFFIPTPSGTSFTWFHPLPRKSFLNSNLALNLKPPFEASRVSISSWKFSGAKRPQQNESLHTALPPPPIKTSFFTPPSPHRPPHWPALYFILFFKTNTTF